MVSTTFYTGTGYWNPLVWLGVFLLLLILVYLVWSRGESAYHRGTEQTKPFISGNPEPAKQDLHLRASHLYWGFMEAIRGYYNGAVPLHTGILNDYILWFLGSMAIVMIAVGVSA